MANAVMSLGRLLLREVKEVSLEDVLNEVRTTLVPRPSQTGIPELDVHFRRQQGLARLGIVGRGYPLLYHIINAQLSLLNGTLCVVDLTHQFSPSHLRFMDPSLLQHIHVFFPTPANLTVTLNGLEEYMMYGDHGSKGIVWVGTIVIGDVSPIGVQGKGNIYFTQEMWKGWVKVERDEVAGYHAGVTPKEVVGEREKRQEAVDEKGWRVSSEQGGEYTFTPLESK